MNPKLWRKGRPIALITPRWFWALTIGFYSITALVYFVIPLGSRWTDALLGTALFAPDAILNAGILEWGYKSLWSPARYIFDWTAGFPLQNSLAGTENLIGWQIFYSPLRWAGFGIVAAYNVLIVASFVISGIGAALLARQLGANRYGACVAGFIFAFVPFHLNHIVHIQTLGVCWSPFAILFLDRYLSSGATKDVVALGATFILTALSGVYFGVFLLLILPTYLLVSYAFGRHGFHRRKISMLAATGVGTAILLMPVIIPYLRFAREHGLGHPPEEVVRFSLAIMDIFKVPSWQVVWSGTWLAQKSTFAAAFPGITAIILGAVLLFLRRQRREHRRLALMLFVLCVVPFVLSLGPLLKVRPEHAFRIAGYQIPLPGYIFLFLSAVRVPMRIVLYSFLFGAVLCGLALSALAETLPQRSRAPMALLVLLLLFVEYRPQPLFARDSVTVQGPLAISDAYPFLAEEADSGGVVELPIADEAGYRTPVMARYAYASAGHLRRVVAYHGGARPAVLDRLERAADRLPDGRALQLLLASGVTRLVVHPNLMKAHQAGQVLAALDGAGYEKLYESANAIVFALDFPLRGLQNAPDPRVKREAHVTGIGQGMGKIQGEP